MELSDKQNIAADILKDDTTNELVFGGGAGGGKSALGVLWLIDMCTNYEGTRWLMGRSKLKALKETTLNTFFDLSSKLDIGHMWDYNAQSGVIKWHNGSEIILKDLFLYPSDPNYDSLGSLEITGAFIDECNQIVYKAWQIVKSRIRYKLDEHGLIPKILGTCNPSKNWVYAEFYKPDRDGILKTTRKFIQSLVTDNPFISKHYIDNLRTLDKSSKARLLDGDWEYDDSPNALCDYESITDIFNNEVEGDGIKRLSADVARFGSDKAVKIVADGLDIIEIESFSLSSTTLLSTKIGLSLSKHGIVKSNAIADEDGVGGGVVDQAKIKGFVNNSKCIDTRTKLEKIKHNSQYKEPPNFYNLKSQCGYYLARMINQGLLSISAPIEENVKSAIIEELEWLQSYNLDKDGKLRILPKKEIKTKLGRSPDYLDTLIMLMYFFIKPSKKRYFSSTTI